MSLPKIPRMAPDPHDPDLVRALDCPVCQAAGIHNSSPSPPPSAKPGGDADAAPRGPRRPVRLTDKQARFMRQVWDYLATAQPGGSPDERLLALVCLLRAARSGHANLLAQDVRSLRVADPHATVAALTASGWLKTTPEAVLAADAQHPASCTLPEFGSNPWSVGRKVRTRASGWSSGVLAHKLLRKTPNTVRLTALYLTSHASPDAAVEFTPDHLVAACALGGIDELASSLKTLVEKGWLAEPPTVGAASVQGRLGEAVAGMAPEPSAEEAPPAPRAGDTGDSDTAWSELDSTDSVIEQAQILFSGREAEVARWVREFRDKHGHGPNWATVAAAHNWPPRQHRHDPATQAAFALLGEAGWLSGLGQPYGLRPGPRADNPAQED